VSLYRNQDRVSQSLPPISFFGFEAPRIMTTIPANTTPKMLKNLVTTKKLFSLVLAFVLMEFAPFMTTSTTTDNSLCSIVPALSATPAAEEIVSIKTILRIARVAGIMATIQVQAARKPKTLPKICWRYGCTPPKDQIQLLAFSDMSVCHKDRPSPGIAVPSSANVDAPVQARTPPTSHMINDAPGEGTFASIAPGDVKIPLPMTIFMMMANASRVPRFCLNVPCAGAAAGVVP
jgi:hypothetical protein